MRCNKGEENADLVVLSDFRLVFCDREVPIRIERDDAVCSHARITQA